MSVEVLISPRISFSHDLNPIHDDDDEDGGSNIPIEIYPYAASCCSVSDPAAFEFAFTVDHRDGSLIRESSTADQLFSDGKLLPIPIEIFPARDHVTVVESSGGQQNELVAENGMVCKTVNTDLKEKKKARSLKELLQEISDEDDDDDDEYLDEEQLSPPPPAAETVSPFWKFRRSSSLNNFDGRKLAKQLRISSRLKLLSRSKSTGGGGTGSGCTSGSSSSATNADGKAGNKSAGWKFRRSKSVGWGGGCSEAAANKRLTNSSSRAPSSGLIGTLRRSVLLTRSNSTGKLPEDKIKVVSTKQHVINQTTTKDHPPFRRSASLNNHNYYYPAGYGHPRRSQHHQRFGRCKSTGDYSGQMSAASQHFQKQSSTKQQRRYSSCPSTTSSSSSSSSPPLEDRRPDPGWRKGQGTRTRSLRGYYGNCNSSSSVRVNPVALNLPSPYISRVSLDVFGFGSLFCNGKIKKKKKKQQHHIDTQPLPV